jgi:hypothetical protein
VAVRMRDPDNALINGPVEPLAAEVAPAPGPGQATQPAGFLHTGLPTTVNADDGDRNFKKWSLINNRLSGLGEVQLHFHDYGAVVSGDGFYDDVYNHTNDNDSPSTVNKTGQANHFTDAARYYDGHRFRVLEAYAFANWSFSEQTALDFRVGKQSVYYGESLFLPGIAGVQGPSDATKAFIPGAEIKSILLPVNQVSFNLSIVDGLSLLGYYKLDYKSTEIFPVGDFFSPSDGVGPGASFVYGSINPAFLNGCPGLFPVAVANQLCKQNGLGGPLLGAPPTINVYRQQDIVPSTWGQYGSAIKYQIFSGTNVGFYFLRYNDPNPTVKLNTGFASFSNTVPSLSTGLVNQYVPVSYNVQYFGGIKLYGTSFSTAVGPFNIGGELSLRDGTPVGAQTIASGDLAPVFSRSKVTQALLSSVFVTNPGFIFDELPIVGEAGVLHVNSIDQVQPQLGISPVGAGDQPFFSKNAWGFQMLALPTARNVYSGWDVTVPISYGMLVTGTPSVPGTFGPLFGQGDKRLSVGLSVQYLQNLQLGIGYNFFFGDSSKNIRGSAVKTDPYSDRDYATINVKYDI